MNMLHAAAQTGDASAAKLLLASASEATHLLQLLENYKSEIMGNIAAQEGLWPVLASAEAGWEKEALQRIARLKLGADSVKHKVRFHDPRGTDLNLPARRWAKAAVRTLEHTRIRLLGFGQLLRDFGSAEVMADFCLKNGWTRANQPEWADDVAKLPMFTCESLPAWKLVIRKMIREQMPDFHNHPDWQAQRNSAKVSGRETRGEIQNAILDDIASALKRIAPPKEMPKSAC
jgi:hypothetical protein